jgi:hypothetical protein
MLTRQLDVVPLVHRGYDVTSLTQLLLVKYREAPAGAGFGTNAALNAPTANAVPLLRKLPRVRLGTLDLFHRAVNNGSAASLKWLVR